MSKKKPLSELDELDLQNAGSQQTVSQLLRAFDEVDTDGKMHGAFGSEGMNTLVERFRSWREHAQHWHTVAKQRAQTIARLTKGR